jgi:hypothetical protein
MKKRHCILCILRTTSIMNTTYKMMKNGGQNRKEEKRRTTFLAGNQWKPQNGHGHGRSYSGKDGGE